MRPPPARRPLRRGLLPLLALLLVPTACGEKDRNPRDEYPGHKDRTLPYQPPTQDEEIVRLIALVRNSGLEFESNGRVYSGPVMAARLEKRHRRSSRRVYNAKDFVGYYANRHRWTGEPWLVRLPDGQKVLLRHWLLEHIKSAARPDQVVDRLNAPPPPPGAPPPGAPVDPIEALIRVVEGSEHTFYAPDGAGDEVAYDALAFAKMLRSKTNWMGSDLDDVDQWMREISGRSFRYDRPYEVATADGRRVEFLAWLRLQPEVVRITTPPSPSPSP